MDANGTRFHLLAGRGDWGLCRPEGDGRTLAQIWPDAGIAPDADAAWDGEHYELTLRPKLFRFDPPGSAGGPSIADRRGAGVDRFGNWFWIADDRSSILVSSSGSGTTSLFWRPGLGDAPAHVQRFGEFGPVDPVSAALPKTVVLGGLAVTEDHYLAVGLVDPAGVLVFDLQAGGPPRRLVWPAGFAFRPFDMSARRRGGVFVLDVDERRLWELDRHFLVVDIGPATAPAPGGGVFHSVGSPPPIRPRSAAGPVELDDAAPLAGEPIAVAAARDGTVLVLDRNSAGTHSLLRRYRGGTVVGSPVPLVDAGLALEVVAHDMALASNDLGSVPAPLGLLYVVGSTGNQAYAFRLSVPKDQLLAAAVPRYLPLRSFGGKALASDGNGAAYDFSDRFVPLVEQQRPRFVASAAIVTPPLDGREPDCIWHRLMLDGCIPPETTVEIWSRAADDLRSLDAAAWMREPTLQQRPDGSELPFLPAPPGQHGTWELLFQRARGRHLQLRLRLTGDERTSPRVGALRAYYPRFSYLTRYLPRVYREDDESASFLERFLANPEGINTALEDRIAAAQILFEPDAAPAEDLDWLAGWFDIALGPNWDEVKRRLFVRNASKFFRLRGTMRGLELALRLALEQCVDEQAFEQPELEHGGPRIVEQYRTRLVPAAALGDPTGPVGPRLVPSTARWRPEHGGEALNDRFRLYVQRARGDEQPNPAIEFAASPTAGELAALWQQFAQGELGFVPSAGVDAVWREFLRARYGRIEALRTAYALKPDASASFDDLSLPTALPPDGRELVDWYQFQAVVLPMRRSAHSFTVLLPVSVGESGAFDHEERRALASRVVSLQKPAHTVFDVRFYWSAFRVGEARLELDTIVDLGSRSPALLTSLVLGRDHLGESYLGGDAAPALTRPPSVGRQTLLR